MGTRILCTKRRPRTHERANREIHKGANRGILKKKTSPTACQWGIQKRVDRTRFYAHLYLHVGLSEPRAKEFWAKALRIKKEQIKYVYRPVPHVSRKKNIHVFGVCSVRIHNIVLHRKLMGWIRAVLDN